MHVQKKHSRHTYSAAKHKRALRKKRNKRLCQLCIKGALCTSTFTLTLLASSEWDISNPQSGLRNWQALQSAALISADTDKQLLSPDTAADDRKQQNDSGTDTQPETDCTDMQDPTDKDRADQANADSIDSKNPANADRANENDKTHTDRADMDAQTAAADSQTDHTTQDPGTDNLVQFADQDADLPAQASNTDEQTLYSVNPDTDSQLYYSYAGSPIQSIPESLPVEQLIDTTADDTEITHFTQDSSDWNLILVNPWNKLPDDYEISLTRLPNGHSIDSRCYPALTEMMNACRNAGFQPLICSSYRSTEKQKSLFQERVDELLAQGYSKKDAKDKAATSVARPGTSEHQAGLAVDVVDSSYQMLDAAQEHTPVQQWLMENSWKYGFILRYPKDKSRLTGIIYEPWHYRYVGPEAAQEIYERGICLEEYLQEQE